MEPVLGAGLGDLWAFIVWPYLLMFILFSSLIKKAFGNFLAMISSFEWKPVYTVMSIALVIGIPYAILGDVTWIQILITYALGTSFHELLWKHIEGAVARVLGKIFGG